MKHDRTVVALVGAYTSGGMAFIYNVKLGQSTAARLIKKGYSVICPWTDFSYGFFEDLEKIDYQENFASQLARADVVFALRKWSFSSGAMADVELAESLNIPVVFSEKELDCFREVFEENRNG